MSLNIPGVYTITNILNNRIYVGCSKNVRKRLNWHRCLLKSNKHSNDRLQKSFNKYGEKSFKFELLTECTEELIFSEEHYWANLLNTHHRKHGFNILPTHPNEKRLIADSTRIKISKSSIGRKFSEKTKELKSKIGKQYKHSIEQSKPVLQFDKNGSFIKEWGGIWEAHDNTGSSRNSIKFQCEAYKNNKKFKKTTCKYIWKYKNI